MLAIAQKQAPQIIQGLENRHEDTRHKGPDLLAQKTEPEVDHRVAGIHCLDYRGTLQSCSWRHNQVHQVEIRQTQPQNKV